VGAETACTAEQHRTSHTPVSWETIRRAVAAADEGHPRSPDDLYEGHITMAAQAALQLLAVRHPQAITEHVRRVWRAAKREDVPVPRSVWRAVNDLLAARLRHLPVAHLTGRQEFCGHWFAVSCHTLVPRPTTELLVQAVLATLPDAHAASRSEERWTGERSTPPASWHHDDTDERPAEHTGPPQLEADGCAEATEEVHHHSECVVDLGVGSGCALISLLLARPRWRGLGVDCSAAALGVASRNLELHGLTRNEAHLLERDWNGYEGVSAPSSCEHRIEELLDATVLVSNPPYLTSAELRRAHPGVSAREPYYALVPRSADDQLADYRSIAELALGIYTRQQRAPTENGRRLKLVAVEVAPGLSEQVVALFAEHHLEVVAPDGQSDSLRHEECAVSEHVLCFRVCC
jgi:methylase of polypeptide subunit release factors